MLSLTSTVSLLLSWQPSGTVGHGDLGVLKDPWQISLRTNLYLTGWINGKPCLWTGNLHRERGCDPHSKHWHIFSPVCDAVLVNSAQYVQFVLWCCLLDGLHNSLDRSISLMCLCLMTEDTTAAINLEQDPQQRTGFTVWPPHLWVQTFVFLNLLHVCMLPPLYVLDSCLE